WLATAAAELKSLVHTFMGLPAGPRGLRFVRPRGLRTYLALFAAALTVPLLALAAVSFNRMSYLERAQLERRVEQVAEDLARLIDRDLDRPTPTLEPLATSRPLAAGDLADFHAQARLALQPDNIAIFLLDRNLNQVLNTHVPFGTHLSAPDDLVTPRRVLET